MICRLAKSLAPTSSWYGHNQNTSFASALVEGLDRRPRCSTTRHCSILIALSRPLMRVLFFLRRLFLHQ